MSEGTIFITEKVCPQCGRNFTVLYPGEWAYKRGRVGHIIYLCSWKCLRAWDGGDTKKEELEVEKDTKKHDRKATLTHMIEMYEEGKSKTEVLRYLQDEGYRVPEQTHADLKAYAKIKLPELYARLTAKDVPAQVMQEAPKKAEPKVKKAAPKPAGKLEDCTTTAIRLKKYGEFYRDFDHNCIDWRTPEGDEVSICVQGWIDLCDDLPKILARLGVEL